MFSIDLNYLLLAGISEDTIWIWIFYLTKNWRMLWRFKYYD